MADINEKIPQTLLLLRRIPSIILLLVLLLLSVSSSSSSDSDSDDPLLLNNPLDSKDPDADTDDDHINYNKDKDPSLDSYRKSADESESEEKQIHIPFQEDISNEEEYFNTNNNNNNNNDDDDDIGDDEDEDDEEFRRLFQEEYRKHKAAKYADGDYDYDYERLEHEMEMETEAELAEITEEGNKNDQSLISIIDNTDPILIRRSQLLSLRLLFKRFKVEQLNTDFKTKILPICRKSNDLFYKLKKIDEDIGINQEFRDTILKLIKQASYNKKAIEELVTDYHKLNINIKSMEELQLEFNKINTVYQMKRSFYVYGEPEKFIVGDILKEDEKEIAKISELENETLKILVNIFLEEQKALIKLGFKLWINSQEDYDKNQEEEIEEEEDRFAQEQRLKMKRQLITSYRSKMMQNETEDGLSKSKSSNSKKDEL